MSDDKKWRGVLDDLLDSIQDDPILIEILSNRFKELTNDEKLNVVIGLIGRIANYHDIIKENGGYLDLR